METASDDQSKYKHELRLTRTFDAPLHLVWEAWSNAEYLARWFTPDPGTSHDVVVDLRDGGDFILTMKFPDGFTHTINAKFTEVMPNKKLVFKAHIHGLDIRTTVDFAESNGKTTMNVHQQYSDENEASRGAPQGWASSLAKFDALVKSLVAS